MSPAAGSHAVRQSAPLFAALGDPTRLYVVTQLAAHGPRSIAQLTAGTEVTRQAVTKHLGVLEEAGVVWSYRAGRERLWELQTERLDQARRTLDALSARWDEALARLQRLVEK